MKSMKSYSRNRFSRSVSMEMGGDLFAVDLEDGYQPVPRSNLSKGGAVTPGPIQVEDEASGMGGVTTQPKTSESLEVPSSIKVTHRYVSLHLSVCVWVCVCGGGRGCVCVC